MHRENDTVTLDPYALCESQLNGKPVLASKVEVGLAFFKGPQRCAGAVAFGPCLLRYDPACAVANPLLDKQKAAYKVDISPTTIGGVFTEIFTPAGGISPGNADRVLIK